MLQGPTEEVQCCPEQMMGCLCLKFLLFPVEFLAPKKGMCTCMCMHTWAHICACTHVCACVHMYIAHVCMCGCARTCVYVHARVHVCVCACTCACMRVYVCTHMCLCVWICACWQLQTAFRCRYMQRQPLRISESSSTSTARLQWPSSQTPAISSAEPVQPFRVSSLVIGVTRRGEGGETERRLISPAYSIVATGK